MAAERPATSKDRVAPAQPLRIAIVGAGRMAQHHAKAIAKLGPQAVVAAIVDPSTEAIAAMRRIVPGAAEFGDLETCLAAVRPDVVHVVTPPVTHATMVRLALAAGVHVYVEKPFVESAVEAEALLALAARNDLKVCAGHQLLYEPPTRTLRTYLSAIGKPVHIESYFSFRTVRRTPDGRTPLRADLQLLDILPHPVYLLLDALERVDGDETELASIEVGPAGTVHALCRRGGLTAALTVTLEGRPVESYLRIVGTNGTLHADYVRSTTQRQIGPGTSGIDKLLAPYRAAWQLETGTTAAMARRFFGRGRSYPGLAELFGAFYDAIQSGGPSPVSPANILGTVRICERVAEELRLFETRTRPVLKTRLEGARVVLTGGTGFLGRAIARALVKNGHPVTVLARREAPVWEQVAGAEYVVADLGGKLPAELFRGAETVVHAAAETAGGWDQHQRNSIDATTNVLAAAAEAGVARVVHVSSLAVLAKPPGNRPVKDDTPLEPDSRGSGPYVWGKLESERLALQRGAELGLAVKVVRPGAIVDYASFDPPGRLGKQVGPLFVAVGSSRERLGIVGLEFCADAIAWMVDHFDEAPSPVNLLDPVLPPKRALIARLRATNPDLRVIWLPWLALYPLSWFAWAAQKVLRPGRPAINVAKVFSVQPCDTSGSTMLADKLAAARHSDEVSTLQAV